MQDSRGQAQADSPLELHQIVKSLTRKYEGLIDLSDAPLREEIRTQVFLSRALAATAVQILTDCTAEDSVAAVTDGRDDLGIDAVAISSATNELWLIQAKWNPRGMARFGEAEALKLIHGFRTLDNQRFDRFNARLQVFSDRIHQVLTAPHPRIYLVAVLMGNEGLTQSARHILEDAISDLDGAAEYRIISKADIHAAIREELSPDPVRITATLSEGWFTHDMPYRAFVGTVSAEEAAWWYQAHGNSLFALNVRKFLGLTTVNQKLVASPMDNPDEFWYFNNGVTIVCDRYEMEFFGRRMPGQPARIELFNASIVNGAQTVASLHEASSYRRDALQDARVMVRVIVVKGAPRGFAQRVTLATNTQNRIEPQDFVALDPVQTRIREDFRLSLGKEYAIRRGEVTPSLVAGCTMAEAATALACTHPNPTLATIARYSSGRLWESAPEGIYTQLFGHQPSAHQIWRSVLLLRSVQRSLHEAADTLAGRAAYIADRGALLVAHLVFQGMDNETIDDPESTWESALDEVPGRVAHVLARLISQVDELYGPHSFLSRLFVNADACRELVRGVLSSSKDQRDPVAVLTAYKENATLKKRVHRRPNSVRILVEHHHIPDGALLMYHPGRIEEDAVGTWLNEDPKRFMATWVNDSRKPLLWAADNRQYSPSGLIMHIWQSAGWAESPVAVRGSAHWSVPGGASLVDLATQLYESNNDDTSASPPERGVIDTRQDGTSGA
ncbi:AIPR family protein [Streptomyces sp. NBC_00341]|uniref:AIPR family protein n=1 Tax=Streptomyces sp. NBC_00341 TaxID=2975717 RepID=UPI003090B798|nr:AIPR family protein [Streptomyces sp. NBC_00341]